MGRLIDQTLIPVAIKWPRSLFPLVDRRSVGEVVDSILPHVRGLVDASVASWAESASERTGRFLDALLARERALVLSVDGARAEFFQPGLFDRRVEHEYRAALAAAADAATDRARRLSRVEEARRMRATPLQLLLVLAP